MNRPPLHELARQRIVLFDGGMGTALMQRKLPLADYLDCENCSETVNLARPDVVEEIHRSFFAAGCDAVETNTFGANEVVLAEFDLAARTREINRIAAQIARKAAAAFETKERPRYVVGSIGPGTRLPSLGHTTFAVLEKSYHEQAQGLLDGGVDALLIETCQDILQTKAALCGVLSAQEARGVKLPLMVQLTMETTGTMLVGTELAAALVALEPYPIDVLGLNCATGPQEMGEHVAYLCRHAPMIVSCQPNAGLPQMVDGQPHYPLKPADLARWLERFVREDGVRIVGGCCGTTPEHLAAVAKACASLTPAAQSPTWVPSLSSLYGAVTVRQDSSFLIIGERTNANGSKQFKKLLEKGDLDGMVAMGREQLAEGAHVVDLCTAYVGRDEVADMCAAVKRFSTQVAAPLSIDSTEAPVLEAALALHGGRCLINSIHMEDGEERMARVLPLAKKFGAAVVALTIDEKGMAKERDEKVAVAERIVGLACRKWGLRRGDILIDPLTFTICTGNEDDRKLGLWTLEGIEQIKQRMPECHTLLGLSNISFGLKPPARHVLNSVFLHHARLRGLDAAIVHAAKIKPLYQIPEQQRQVAEDLIFDRRRPSYDPLQELIGLFEDVVEERAARPAARSIEERLKERIVRGEKPGLEADLDLALERYAPLSIINDLLLDGMKTVGELFASGEMQLPFVLQSAETMKAAVAFLEPKMERKSGDSKGRIVLATVRGDVHDIGKNLVDIILSNNGFTIVNLGIKQPLSAMLEAARTHDAHAIGMSGLLVKSTVVMKENLEEMNRLGIALPVVLGGAALTRSYVERDLRAIYKGPLHYARDAFEGLDLAGKICGAANAASAAEQAAPPHGAALHGAAAASAASGATASGATREDERRDATAAAEAASAGLAPVELPRTFSLRERPISWDESQVPPAALATVAVPDVPFFGTRVVEKIPLQSLVPLLNERLLFQFQWGFKRGAHSEAEWKAQMEEHARPAYLELLKRCAQEEILQPKAIYGLFPCQSVGETVIVYDETATREVARMYFPRQVRGARRCIADFFRSQESGEMDVIGIQLVTVGQRASDIARTWFRANRYRDYLYLHGLSVEMAEALAEYIHRQIRSDLGIAGDDARDLGALLRQGYRGSRYSFGYPACPDLSMQAVLNRLLGAERIGVTLSEEFQLDPEQSTSAIVVHHSQAKYFAV
ncbi:MAG: methionine synthase [Planctomycetes bacterium]|nr:methionine synthase [Planctomycetota bacterium]